MVVNPLTNRIYSIDAPANGYWKPLQSFVTLDGASNAVSVKNVSYQLSCCFSPVGNEYGMARSPGGTSVNSAARRYEQLATMAAAAITQSQPWRCVRCRNTRFPGFSGILSFCESFDIWVTRGLTCVQ